MTRFARPFASPRLGAALLLVVSAISSVARGSDPTPFVTVALRPSAAVNGRLVLIGDIADVQSGNRWLASTVARIDISDPPLEGRATLLRKSQVEIRLMLAGYTQDQFQVVGAPATRVGLIAASPVDDAAVMAAVRRELVSKLDVAAADVNLVLLKPLQLRTDYDRAAPGDVRLDVRLPTSVKSKVLNTKIGIHVQGRLNEVANASFEMTIDARVAKTRADVRAGDVFSPQNLTYEKTPVDAETLARVAPNVIGRRSGRNLDAGQVVEKQHLMSTAQIEREVLVRPRDTVHVIARRGGLTVRMKDASALDVGRRGDTVRVRNPKTDKVLQGRVTSARVVEIPF